MTKIWRKEKHYYTVNHKKRGTLFLTITTTFLGLFLHFFAANETGINTLHCTYLTA